jgi:autotransporter-associated beta strand protein
MYVGADGKLRTEVLYHGSQNPITSSQVVNDNKWHYVADVFNNGTETLYLDGASIGTASGLSLSGFANSYAYTIGTGYASSAWPSTNNGWFYFNGSIDNPAVYNYGLTAAQVAAHFSAASANSGTTYTWTNPASGGAWSNGANWSAGAIADGADNSADFSSLDIAADNTVHLDSSRTIGNLVFGDTMPSNNWTIDNNANSANALTLLLTSANTPRITVNNQTATISAVLAGNQGFMKLGAGTLVLSGANTVSGAATVTAGTLQLGGANALQNTTATVNVNGGLTFGSGIGTFNLGGLAGSGTIALNDSTVAATAVTLNLVGSGTATYSGVLSGPGSISSSGTGTQTLSGVNTYSGGTTVNAGRIISTTSASLGTGGVTLGGGSLRPLPNAPISLLGFGTGTNWTVNSLVSGSPNNFAAPFPSANTLMLTANNISESRTAFYNTPVPVASASNGFTVAFTYTNLSGTHGTNTNVGSGVAFVLQNDPRGVAAIGGQGGNLGYGGGLPNTPIQSSVAFQINISPPSYTGDPGAPIGVAWVTNGSAGKYVVSGPVNENQGDPINVTLAYNAATHALTETLVDATTGQSYVHSDNSIDVASVLGAATAYVGFTGGTGAIFSSQTITNFSYEYGPVGAYSNNVTLSAGTASGIEVGATFFAPTITMGTLTVSAGAPSTLNVTAATGTPTNQAYGLTLGATALNGNVSLNVANNGSGAGTLQLGSLNDGGTARTITLAGPGAVTLASAATSLVPGTQFNVNAGTLNSNQGTALGTTAQISVSRGATFNVGANQTISALNGAGSVNIAGNTLTIGGSDNLSSSFSGGITGSGNIVAAGTGSIALSGTNSYSGGTVINAGRVISNTAGSLGSGAIMLNGGMLRPVGPSFTLAGFGGNGTGWTVNSQQISAAPFPQTDVLQLTDNNNNEGRSAFFNTPASVVAGSTGFIASFTYTPTSGLGNGVAFVLQNDSRGAAALGGVGAGLGYGSANSGIAIQPSVAFEMSILSDFGVGVSWQSAGATSTSYTSISPVILNSGHPINVTLSYDPTIHGLTETLVDSITNATYNTTDTSIDVGSALGSSMAFVGFTGSTGGVVANQQISNFSYRVGGAPVYANGIVLGAGTTSGIEVGATSAAPMITLGPLTVSGGAASTLNVMPAPTLATDQAYGLNLGNVALNSSVTLNVANNGAGQGTLTLGALMDGGVARTINFNSGGSGGAIVLSGAGSLVAGTQINLNGGSLTANAVIGSQPGNVALAVAGGSALRGNGTINGPVTVASGGHLAPGSGGIGTLSTGPLTLSGGSVLDYVLGTPGVGTPSLGGNSALVTVGGALTLPSSGTITVNLTDNAGAGGEGALGTGTYTLLRYTSLNSTASNFNGIFNIGTTPLTGELYTFSNTGTGAGEIDLTIHPPPMPPILSSWIGVGSGSWGAAGNWDSGVPSSVGDTASFGNSIPSSASATITLDGDRTISTLTFSATGGRRYTIAPGSGGTLTLNNGSANVSVNVVAGSQTISAPVSLSSGTVTMNLSSGSLLTLSGNLSGTGQLVQSGSGTLILTGANTNSGGITVSGGTLQGNTASLTNDITNNGTLVFNQLSNATYSHSISGAGNVMKTGAGNLTLTGNNTYTGLTTIVTGTLTQNGGTLTGDVDNQDSFIYSAGVFNGFLTNEQTAVFNAAFTAGNGMENDGTAANAGQSNVTISGIGLVNIANFTMTGGTLRLSPGTTNSNSGTLTFGSSATLALSGATLTNSATLSLNGTVINGSSGALMNDFTGTVSGTGTITAQLTNKGSIVVGNGTLIVTNSFSNSGTIQLTGPASILGGGLITNTGTIQGFGGLGNAVNNSGTIEATGGTINIAGVLHNQATGLIVADSNSKVLVSTGLATNAGTINLIGGKFDNNGNPLNNTGQISGFGTFATGGSGIDNNGSITYSGGLTTVNGPLTNENGKTVVVAYNPAIFTGLVTNSGGGTFNIISTTATFAGGSSGTIGGTFTNNVASAFSEGGSGVLEVDGAPTLNNSSSLSASDSSTLRFKATSGSATVGTGVTATVNNSAMLELAGSVSALSFGSNRVNIRNNSSAAAGILVSGTHQQVGNIDGSGKTQVNAGSDLTANHIIQSALVIGGTAGSSGGMTIAPSDAAGNPLGQMSSEPSTAAGGAAASFSDSPSSAEGFDGDPIPAGSGPAPLSTGSGQAVPEPSTLLLAFLALLGLVCTSFARRYFHCQTN